MKIGWMAGAVALVVVGLAGCSGAAPSAPATSAATTTVSAPVKSAEDKFYDDVQAPQWLPANVRALSKADMVATGRKICETIGKPDITRPVLEAALVAGTVMDARTTSWVLDAAHNYLCPGKPYAYAPVFTTTVAPPPPPVPAGPVEVLTTEGDKEVGVDMKPGKWRSAGGPNCLWTLEGAGAVDSNYGPGSQIAVMKAGQLFHTEDCGTWTLQK